MLGVEAEEEEWTGVFNTEYVLASNIVGSEAYVSGLRNNKGKVDVPGDTTGRLESDAFQTVDLYLGLRSESWSARLFAKNILDDDGVLSKRPLSASYNELTVSVLRTLGITLRYHD